MSNNNYIPEIVINAVIAHKGNKQVCFGVVSSVSNNTGSDIGGVDIITKNGYAGVYEPVGVPYRKAVTIELPEGVHYGYYVPVPRCSHHIGYYADYKSKDGNGCMVYVSCNPQLGDTVSKPAAPDSIATIPEHDYSSAIDRTIAAGLTMSVPQPDGSRKIVPVKVLAVTELYGDRHPGYNA